MSSQDFSQKIFRSTPLDGYLVGRLKKLALQHKITNLGRNKLRLSVDLSRI